MKKFNVFLVMSFISLVFSSCANEGEPDEKSLSDLFPLTVEEFNLINERSEGTRVITFYKDKIKVDTIPTEKRQTIIIYENKYLVNINVYYDKPLVLINPLDWHSSKRDVSLPLYVSRGLKLITDHVQNRINPEIKEYEESYEGYTLKTTVLSDKGEPRKYKCELSRIAEKK